jgi:anti-sigma regulatory factor (Ser/Thr protein kinase)
MPLGLMPGMQYEEVEAQLSECDALLLSSDGLVEAHNPNREMYGFERMVKVMESEITTEEIVPEFLRTLKEFTGENYEQEDDITLVTLLYTTSSAQADAKPDWSLVAEFDIPSQPGNERAASEKALEILGPFNLDEAVNNRLQTAVAEASMNAMEHGNHYREDLPVHIKVMSSAAQIAIQVHDFGGGLYQAEVVVPDLDSKLAGEQSPRGWGLFLIKNMVDEMNMLQGEHGQIIELIVNRQAA